MTTEVYAVSPEEALKSLKSSEAGLSKKEVEDRLEHHGFNELPKGKKATAIGIFLSQFKNALILLLVFAGMLSMFLGEDIEAIAIFVIILLNTILGFIQEFRAEKAIEALEQLSAPQATVMRDGKAEKIPAKNIVPGDILVLEAGDIVAADSRIITQSSLQIDEASLTGESVPSGKVTEPFKIGTSIADQENMAFMGTIVTYGKGTSVVTGTGMHTELGKIATSIQETGEVQTPLQRKFAQLAKQIGVIAIVLIIAVLVAGTLQGTAFSKMLLVAVALTVSTVPNSLPIIVTVSLSMGSKRLTKKNMLVKKLPAAESLGAVTMICSDKTGTITKNQMTVTDIFTNNEILKVSGTGYEPKGSFHLNNKDVDSKHIELLLRTGFLCNNAKLVEDKNKFSIIGDPTEGSLIVLGRKGNLTENSLKAKFTFVEELPFDSDRKCMSSIYKNNSSRKTEAYVKGAPDLLLKACDRIIINGKVKKLTPKDRKNILKMNDSFANKALRVLSLAYREVPATKKFSIKSVERNLIFIGLVGMIDPPREGVKEAITQCSEAGIRVMIITGDHAITTRAVGEQIGLFKEGDVVLTGDEVEKLTDEQLTKKIDNVRIIARALPIQKSRVVDALKKHGHIVAMTGDGVNDAPALKKADIGIAMGITGTDVSKEVSKAILVDDNFTTIVKAVGEGRNIYDKMIKSAKYLLSCNAGEITAVFMAIMLRFPLPLLPLQILLMNLLTDDFPALGLGFEKSEKGVMSRPPRDPKAKPITRRIFASIVLFGLIMGLGTLFMFASSKGMMQTVNIQGHEIIGDWNYAGSYNAFVESNPLTGNEAVNAIIEAKKEVLLALSRTIAFTTLVMFQMFAVMSSRTLFHSFKSLNPFSNLWLLGAVCLSLTIQVIVIYWTPLQKIFGTVAISLSDWLMILVISSLGFVMMEVSKFFVNPKKGDIH
ncbi:MAG: cation-translocating P-type ATPase [bacterium]|nr:cation-translocating P-type ATPase [bacterium]